MNLKWIILIVILVAVFGAHDYLAREAIMHFGPLDNHRRLVLVEWLVGVVGAYVFYVWWRKT